jgi:hypothetical protein
MLYSFRPFARLRLGGAAEIRELLLITELLGGALKWTKDLEVHCGLVRMWIGSEEMLGHLIEIFTASSHEATVD